MDCSSKRTKSFIFLVAFSLLVIGCGGKPDASEDQGDKQENGKEGEKKEVEAVPVEVISANNQTINANYSGTANLDAPNEAQVVAKSSGVMVSQIAEEGDYVQQGQVLARIDPARALLEVQRSRATVNKLNNNFLRAQQLLAQKLISTEAYDQIRYDLEATDSSDEAKKIAPSH